MAFPDLTRRITDRAFETFGFAADWDGQAVLIRLGGADDDGRYGAISMVRRDLVARVRSWEVAQPVTGQIITVAAGTHQGRYEVGRGVMRDGKGVWLCPVLPAP